MKTNKNFTTSGKRKSAKRCKSSIDKKIRNYEFYGAVAIRMAKF